MKNETCIFTHLFYFMPKSVTFKSKDVFLSALGEETKQSVYSKFGINTASDPSCFDMFLKEMKKHISAKNTSNGYVITKDDTFKLIAENDSNTWSSQYRTLLTKLSKRLIVSAISYEEQSSIKKLNDSQKIRIVAEFYKKVDSQVSEWLFELAKMKE